MRYVLAVLMALIVGSTPLFAQPTATTNRVWRPVKDHPDKGHFARFVNVGKLRAAKRADAPTFKSSAAVKLPIDWSKGFNFPMDLNDTYGDCYYAAGCHADNTWTANVGGQSVFALSSIKSRYFALSGGDNGLSDQDMQGEMMGRYLADVKEAKIVSWANIDPTDANSCQAALQAFGVVMFTMAVPDAWINNSDTGAVWDQGVANPNNGHAVIFNGCRTDGAYTLQTWGTYVWITPQGVRSCDPAGWVAFSPRWFNAKGFAPNGKHITELATFWKAATGKDIPASVIGAFPGPEPAPPPTPTPLPPATSARIIIQIPGMADQVMPFSVPAGGKTVPDGTPQELIDALNKVFKGQKVEPKIEQKSGSLEMFERRLAGQERNLGATLGIIENMQQLLATATKKPKANPRAGRIHLKVPEDAKVYFNRVLTKSQGSYREYVTNDLGRGEEWDADVMVVRVEGGVLHKETRYVKVRAGSVVIEDFTQ